MRSGLLSSDIIKSAVEQASSSSRISISDADIVLMKSMYENANGFQYSNDKTDTAKYYMEHNRFSDEYLSKKDAYQKYIENINMKKDTVVEYKSFDDILNSNEHVKSYKDYLSTFDIGIEYFALENKELADEINSQYDILMKKTLNGIISYASDNNVKINSFDDMKVVYFLAIEAYSLYREKNFLLCGVKILSQISAAERESFINGEMYGKIIDSIENEKWRDNYGKFGIYTIFKEHYKGKTEILK